MEVKEFVTQTLTQIIEGIVDAQEYARANGAVINPGEKRGYSGQNESQFRPPNIQVINFEISITSSDGTQAKSGIHVFFPPVSASAAGSSSASANVANRVQFSLPIVFPEQKT